MEHIQTRKYWNKITEKSLMWLKFRFCARISESTAAVIHMIASNYEIEEQKTMSISIWNDF